MNGASEELKAARRRQDLVADVAYVGGAALVVLGLALSGRWGRPVEVAGAFCLLPPMLQLASGFLRGVFHTQKR